MIAPRGLFEKDQPLPNVKLSYKTAPLLAQLISFCAAGFLCSCATEPPPLPPNNPADPQVRGSARTPRNLLAKDETTLAIERQLSAVQAYAESAEKMEHDVGNVSRMERGAMKQGAMQHGAMAGHEPLQPKNQTSEPVKEKIEQRKSAGRIYTCPMHSQVRSVKPGNCPICGMTLGSKEDGAHEEH